MYKNLIQFTAADLPPAHWSLALVIIIEVRADQKPFNPIVMKGDIFYILFRIRFCQKFPTFVGGENSHQSGQFNTPRSSLSPIKNAPKGH